MEAANFSYYYGCSENEVSYLTNLGIRVTLISCISGIEHPGSVVIVSQGKDLFKDTNELLRKIRRSGHRNPIIVISLKTDNLTIKLSDPNPLRIGFLRFPFTLNDFNEVLENLDDPGETAFFELQQLLIHNNINDLWKKLKHGGILDFKNSLFFPLEIALSSDMPFLRKRSVIVEMLDTSLKHYYDNEDFQDLLESIQNLDPTCQWENDIKIFFKKIEELYSILGSLKNENCLEMCKRNIDFCAPYLQKINL